MAGQVHPASAAASAPPAPFFNSSKMPGATLGPLAPPATYAKPHHRARRGGLAGCCCCLFASLCSLLLLVLFLAGITILVLWLVLKPIHLPKYDLDVTNVSSLSIGPNSTLNADLAYNLTANNPNHKIGIYYDTIKVDTTFEAAAVTNEFSFHPFFQGHRNVTVVSTTVNLKDFPVAATAATAFSKQIQENRVPLHIRGDAQVRVKIGSYTSPHFWVRMDCDVVVAVNPGSVINKSCKLNRRS